jgi:glucose uptake protein
MILAQNHFQTLLLLIVSALCWGLWAAVYRKTHKLRYELFYFDLAIGAAIVAVVCALTVGSLGFDGFSFVDDVMHAGKRQWLFAFGAGVIFNLANMLVMGAISVAGLSVALPLGVGISSMFGMGITVLMGHFGNPIWKFPGSACLLLAVILVAVAYSLMISERQDKLVKEGKVKTTNVPGYGRGMIVSTDAPSATKGLLLSGVAAALMWIMYPLLNFARAGETGLGPYSCVFLFMGGVFLSTFIYNLFFLNLPVEGEPLELIEYFRLPFTDHLLGAFAGAILCCALLGELVSEAGPPEAQVGTVMTYGIKQASIPVAAIWGVWVWKDFRDAGPRIRTLTLVFTGLMALGVLFLVLASMTGQK